MAAAGAFMAGEFKGKVALVTGGGSGIGRATVIAFAREGASVCLFDVDKKGAEDTRRLIEKQGGSCLVIIGNITKSADCKRAVSETVRQFGKLDVLVNCAGIECKVAPVERADEKDWQRVIDVDLTGTFLMCKHAVLRIRDGGSVVNISSGLGLHPGGELASYCCAKAGVVMLTRVLALELAPRIRVNCVCPGPIDTPLLWRFATRAEIESIVKGHYMRRLGKPEEVADAILFLASKRASYITGAVLNVGAQI